MPSYLLSSGLPDMPVGLTDKEASLITPLYRAINSLAKQMSVVTGSTQYTSVDQANLDQAIDLTIHRSSKIYVKASEFIAYGKLVTVSIDSGKIVASLADASDLTKPAHAICDTPGGIAIDEFGPCIFMQGKAVGVSGASIGTTYYLSTSGDIQSTSPTADGVLNQIVGVGLGSIGLYLNIEPVGQRVCRVYKTSPTNMRIQYTDGSFVDWPV